MRPEDLIEELLRSPFVNYEIRHPELVIVFPGKAIIATPGKDKPQPAEGYDVVSLGPVRRLAPLPTSV